MTNKFRWGILGAGNIAKKFCAGVQALADHELVAVGSRSQEKADQFGAQFNIPHRHNSYEALAADPAVDAIYVATPHPMHKDHSLLCLRHGKAVLCEKPFTINAAEAKVVIDEARRLQIFLMEAMWTRFVPAVVEAKRLIDEGAIGEVRMINADFGFRAGFNPASRAFDPALGGGGLLDVGVYPISLASMLLGRPNRIATLAELGQTGVDEQSAFILGYPGDVAVHSTDFSGTNAPWGELMTTVAMRNGAVGCIVDSQIRDTIRMIDLGFPVYYTGIRPLDSQGRARVMAYDVPVRCGDVLVHPGDLVFADHDGIVVIPQAIEQEVITLAQEKVSKESQARIDLQNGKSLRAVYDTYGVL